MKLIHRLNIDSSVIYDACVGGIADHRLADRFKSARSVVMTQFDLYVALALIHKLFQCEAVARGQSSQVVLADLSKGELVDLYSKCMVAQTKPARAYYDQLMMLAPNGKCPFCGFGQATTLDHFLSKARYPAFSTLDANLVPACTDCNGGKVASESTAENQILHPYFEDKCIEAESWLFAEILESAPACTRYFARPPDCWPMELKLRVENHFNSLGLAKRFSTEAATALSSLYEQMQMLPNSADRKAHLDFLAITECRVRKNSWLAALYVALAANDWYLNIGYRSGYQQ